MATTPTFSHIVFMTRRFEEMKAWYINVFGAEIVHGDRALAFLASCVSTSSVRLGGNEYPAVDDDAPVAVYEVLSDIDAQVEKVGIVQAEAGLGTSWPRMIESLQCEARTLGANAIVLVHADERDETLTTTYFDWSSGEQRSRSIDRISALAVRVEAQQSELLVSSALEHE